VGSNPIRGMNVCVACVFSVFVLFCVLVSALRPIDPPSKESTRAVEPYINSRGLIIMLVQSESGTLSSTEGTITQN
jgi:hypothetical protein